MRQLPSGTVTFLFSDIEGSTKLLDELGPDAYAAELAGHRRKLREAFAAQGGVEVDTQGDAFFVAFPTAQGALAAARDAQAALSEGPIRVRMGIHSGEPLLTDEGYVGIDVHRGARVMSAGHGGQVLVSAETYALLDGDLGLLELGRHRLKDLTEPQPLYQLGEGDFPPLKTLYQTNLPVQPTPLVGREAELTEVLALLEQSRLVTLTGPGGAGKTRLALQAAAELVDEQKDGVWWVSLAALRDPELVEPTIAQVVGAKDGLADYLRAKNALLLLDNFEQLLDAARQVAAVIAEAPALRVLVTSRERLGIAAEQEYPVPTLVDDEAVALFIARARRLDPAFEPDEHIADICRSLDGLPLAIELVAARVKVLSPEQILERLGSSLDLLTASPRDASDRHRTLRATIEWSYDLLTTDEQELFARLSVFGGGFDLEAAESICGADLDTLAALVDKSLLRRAENDRFFMLETIREFALEQAGSRVRADENRRRHARYFRVKVTDVRKNRLDGEAAERIERDDANFRAALEWTVTHGSAEEAVSMCERLAPFWELRDRMVEANQWFGRALALPGPVDPALRADALSHRAWLAFSSLQFDESKAALDECLEIGKQLGDLGMQAEALRGLAVHVRVTETDLGAAATMLEEALEIARSLGDRDGERKALHLLGEVERDRGTLDRATCLLEASAALSQELGDPIFTAATLHSLGDVALDQGDVERAAEQYRASLIVARDVGFTGHFALCLCGLACVALGAGDAKKARLLWDAVTQYEQQRGVGLQPDERARYEKVLEPLGPSGLDPLELEEAVEYALTR